MQRPTKGKERHLFYSNPKDPNDNLFKSMAAIYPEVYTQ